MQNQQLVKQLEDVKKHMIKTADNNPMLYRILIGIHHRGEYLPAMITFGIRSNDKWFSIVVYHPSVMSSETIKNNEYFIHSTHGISGAGTYKNHDFTYIAWAPSSPLANLVRYWDTRNPDNAPGMWIGSSGLLNYRQEFTQEILEEITEIVDTAFQQANTELLCVYN